LSALPEKYRAPIVLCDLEGLSYREAATRLRCPPGTLSGRLTRARALLARRMARHGLTVTAAALAALLAQDASASLPASLRSWATRARTALAAGKGLTDGVVSSHVATLAEGVLKMLLLSKLKTWLGVFVVLAVVLAAGWACAARVSARAPLPDENRVPWATEEPQAPDDQDVPPASRAAEFEFRGAAKGGKTVSLIVAGTSAPVLCLPVKKDLRVLVGGGRVGMDELKPGSLVTIRLDATNQVIEEVRALDHRQKPVVVRSASDLARLESPSTQEVLRALPRGPRDVPMVLTVFRDDLSVVAEQLARQVDPPRFYPLVGVAELHHVHWKCTVYYTETVESCYPFPVRSKRSRVEIVYIDKDYLVPTNKW
jgi:hypothetical protein